MSTKVAEIVFVCLQEAEVPDGAENGCLPAMLKRKYFASTTIFTPATESTLFVQEFAKK